ncbi:MAG: 4Fe-4S cluster-binding domain-containing protein [Candidatus Omnitrophica bacterium]|nr:4Fe-4S cluster-binding domain-containing protein [Candidatus Omnitrophota bacterium]
MKKLPKIQIPLRYNYIAAFLTLGCNMNCPYCINMHSSKNRGFLNNLVSGKNWVKGLNRLKIHSDLPITLQGGEPSLHPNFIWIVNHLNPDLKIDILTNLSFNINRFIKEIDPSRFCREAPYPSIRVSYHLTEMNLDDLIEKVLKLKKAGFSIGIYGLLYPEFKKEVLAAQKKCRNLGVDFRTKEFLGKFKDKIYGTYRYPEAICGNQLKKCLCRTSEFIIGPDCGIYRCHHDLYENFSSIGNLLDFNFSIKDIFRECRQFGNCNPCDIKVKTNRFQIYGHTSVEIKKYRSLK